MTLQVTKWGNSLALRIPKSIANDAGLKVGVSVRASVTRGVLSLVVQDQPAGPRNLKQLLKGMTPEHFKHAVTWGRPVGKEVW